MVKKIKPCRAKIKQFFVFHFNKQHIALLMDYFLLIHN